MTLARGLNKLAGMTMRRFALLLGLLLILAGIAGYLPFLTWPEPGVAVPDDAIIPAGAGRAILGTGDAMLLGLFPVNPALSALHLAVGLWGMVAMRTRPRALLYARGSAVLFFALALLG